MIVRNRVISMSWLTRPNQKRKSQRKSTIMNTFLSNLSKTTTMLKKK